MDKARKQDGAAERGYQPCRSGGVFHAGSVGYGIETGENGLRTFRCCGLFCDPVIRSCRCRIVAGVLGLFAVEPAAPGMTGCSTRCKACARDDRAADVATAVSSGIGDAPQPTGFWWAITASVQHAEVSNGRALSASHNRAGLGSCARGGVSSQRRSAASLFVAFAGDAAFNYLTYQDRNG